ncbi:MAG: aminotransferase class IV [Polyangiaceae bacterium]|jgi:branched-chain amino acid aminotransferase|nr:aminotransferase class IV [Polyangiaceae bacterium]MBK8937903.1 aminotransferase class IV [Polyangiaceae bacterium]
MFVAIDGELVAPEQATISVFDRGFLYGDSVFDTTRTYAGAAFKLREHVERLARSASKMGFELPRSVEELVVEVQRLIDEVRPRAGGAELVARLMITRGEGPFGLDPTEAVKPRRVLYLHGLSRPTAGAYEDGVEVICYSTFRPSDAALGAKVGNYLESVLAVRQAKSRGAHEALILSYDGHVVEGTTTNVFALHGDRLLTPPTTETLLPGITRGLVLEVAPSLGLSVEERRMAPTDVASADEAFLTSSIRELLPISKIDGHTIGRGAPYAVTRRLHQAVRERFGMVGPAPWQ